LGTARIAVIRIGTVRSATRWNARISTLSARVAEKVGGEWSPIVDQESGAAVVPSHRKRGIGLSGPSVRFASTVKTKFAQI
jgi:hypothetical protein